MMSTDSLLKHAKKYGTDGVAETAADAGFSLEDLTTLLVELDSIDQASTPRIAQRHRKINLRAVCEGRAKKLLGITDDEQDTA